MSNVGQRERATQDRVVKFFQNSLNYDYFGDWQDRDNNKNIESNHVIEVIDQAITLVDII